jgi:hypothetical protein
VNTDNRLFAQVHGDSEIIGNIALSGELCGNLKKVITSTNSNVVPINTSGSVGIVDCRNDYKRVFLSPNSDGWYATMLKIGQETMSLSAGTDVDLWYNGQLIGTGNGIEIEDSECTFNAVYSSNLNMIIITKS